MKHTYTCKSKRLYDFLKTQGFVPELVARELNTGLPISLFVRSKAFESALTEWSTQYKTGGEANAVA